MTTALRQFYCQGCFRFFTREGHGEKLQHGKNLCDPCSLEAWGKWKAMVYQLAVYRMSLTSPELREKGDTR